ncbi:hypothetical protein [Streptomyces erythrochromogenes]|uniref:hypothetical protein n=1 Tax=Streptomyces erythrochromogenes TaxID=285574 RepID=UPI0036F7268F
MSAMWMRVRTVDPDTGETITETAKVIVKVPADATLEPSPLRLPPCKCDRCAPA